MRRCRIPVVNSHTSALEVLLQPTGVLILLEPGHSVVLHYAIDARREPTIRIDAAEGKLTIYCDVQCELSPTSDLS